VEEDEPLPYKKGKIPALKTRVDNLDDFEIGKQLSEREREREREREKEEGEFMYHPSSSRFSSALQA